MKSSVNSGKCMIFSQAQARSRLSPKGKHRPPFVSSRSPSPKSRKEHARIAIHIKPKTTTVWSFPDRGDWANHVGNYRGNWSPYIPRNLILRYTAPGEFVSVHISSLLFFFLGRRRHVIDSCQAFQQIGININHKRFFMTFLFLNNKF